MYMVRLRLMQLRVVVVVVVVGKGAMVKFPLHDVLHARVELRHQRLEKVHVNDRKNEAVTINSIPAGRISIKIVMNNVCVCVILFTWVFKYEWRNGCCIRG